MQFHKKYSLFVRSFLKYASNNIHGTGSEGMKWIAATTDENRAMASSNLMDVTQIACVRKWVMGDEGEARGMRRVPMDVWEGMEED